MGGFSYGIPADWGVGNLHFAHSIKTLIEDKEHIPQNLKIIGYLMRTWDNLIYHGVPANNNVPVKDEFTKLFNSAREQLWKGGPYLFFVQSTLRDRKAVEEMVKMVYFTLRDNFGLEEAKKAFEIVENPNYYYRHWRNEPIDTKKFPTPADYYKSK